MKLIGMHIFPTKVYFLLDKSKYSPIVQQFLFLKPSNYVPFIWQTKFYTQHELTCICRALEAAASSSLESMFGSIHWHADTIDSLPQEGMKIQSLLHSISADNCKILLNLRHTTFLTNSFHLFLFSYFQTMYSTLSVLLDIQNFQYHKLFTTPPVICCYTWYSTKSVEE